MKYHYQIVSSFDPTDIPVDTRNTPEHPGYKTVEAAGGAGEILFQEGVYDKRQYYVKVIPVPETVVEEDELQGHPYPGHEMWDDYPDTPDDSF